METNWQFVICLVFATSAAVCIGRMWFSRWFNPLSIYSAIWGFCLGNYALRLIQYYPISATAWTYIGLAWVSLYLGAAAVLALCRSRRRSGQNTFVVDLQRLKNTVFGLSAIGSLGLIGQLVAISRQFGNPFVALVVNLGDVYGARISGELSGLSYVGDFSFAACALAGVYTAKVGRLTTVALLPLLLVTLQLIALAGRTGLGVAAVLFVVSFIYTPKTFRFRMSNPQKISLALAGILLVGGFFFVSSVRHLDVNFPGITPAMEEISQYAPFFPSIYANFSATPVAFSMYLSTPEESKSGFWGMYTVAPVFRFLARLGFPTGVPPYEENYYTPVPMNTGTYLKNVHSDFGFAGIVLFPFFLAAAVTFLIVRASVAPRLVGLVVLSNIFVLVVFAFAFNFMVLGDWYASMIVSTAAAFVVEHRSVGTERRTMSAQELSSSV